MKTTCLTLFFTAIFGSVYAQWSTNGTNVYYSGGNVGIGTSTPTNSFTVAGGGTGFALYNTPDPTTNYERLVQQYQSNVFTLGSYFGGTGTATRAIRLGVQTTVNATTLSGARMFTINASPSVGAGVFDFNAGASGAGTFVTVNTTFGGTSGQQNMFAIQGTVNQGAGIAGYTGLLIAPFESTVGTGNNYLIDAGTNSAAAGGGTHTSYLLLTNTGNLGIGTTDNGSWQLATSPYKLNVGGNGIISTAVTIQSVANWPDYVFNRDYQLPALRDVECYISRNHHLPGIPSAQKLIKDGLDLGEMNKILVKKVEELTLYLIEKDKKEKEQEARITKLEEEVKALLRKAGETH